VTKSWQEALLHALSTAKDDDEIACVLTRAARELGFDYVAYGIHVPIPVTRPKTVILGNYPDAWRERYLRENFVAIDPTVSHGKRSVMPLIWTEQLFASSPDFWEEAKSQGLRFGWSQALHSARGGFGMLSLARGHDDLSPKALQDNSTQMSWLAYAMHEMLSSRLLARHVPEAAAHLSPREVDVLRWTAEGKTSADIAIIMNLSERTVNFHVNNAVAKLDASNKISATVKASVLGLLER
jgi:LuxR family transcriptional regulator, quorum-sensing system regulator SolR